MHSCVLCREVCFFGLLRLLNSQSHPSSSSPTSAFSSLTWLPAETPEIVPVNNGLHNCYFPTPQPVDQVCDDACDNFAFKLPSHSRTDVGMLTQLPLGTQQS